jgi:nicotinamidase-related amidase
MNRTEPNKNDHSNPSKTALLLIDVISDFEFEDGEKLFENALPMAMRLKELKARAERSGIPVIYVNDNYGKWQEDFKEQVRHNLENPVRGRKIVELLAPSQGNYYVLKPKHSAFYKTVLDVLLPNLEIERLILTGVTTDMCVLFTAIDAYMREMKIVVPEDCVAAVSKSDHEAALDYMKRVLDAEIVNSNRFEFARAEVKSA